jgi:3-oxoacyl-[acyl-carrier-protein] synthase III
MKSVLINRRGRIVLPSNFFPSLDFSVIRDLGQLAEVIKRDFEAKAPTGTEILRRVESGEYRSRYGLIRDMALNLFWANRYSITMYTKRVVRWRDVPRRRDDVFLPVLTPWEEGERKVAAVEGAYRALPATWDAGREDHIFSVLFDVFRNRRHHATELPAVKPTVAEALADPRGLTFHLTGHDPDYPVYTDEQIIECAEDQPELEALHRWAMVLHNQYPWNRAETRLTAPGEVGDDDFVVTFTPRDREVASFLHRVRQERRPDGARPAAATAAAGQAAGVTQPGPAAATPAARPPVRPFAPVQVRTAFKVMPRIEAVAAVKGELSCSNEDIVRNAAFSWSPMTAAEILRKTGIEARRYTSRALEDLALDAARAVLAHAGRQPEEIGALLVCTCTSTRLIPSAATWLSGELGMYQTYNSSDIIAACAGLPYGLAEAVRLLQEVQRPVLLVCAEKFSDKIGSVRTSRMIFGDGAAALLVGPAGAGQPPDVEVLQTYASGPVRQVNSIIWPNPEFDNNITVLGPDVRDLVQRYLEQMLAELRSLPDPDARAADLLASIELIVPHQANKTMVTQLAKEAGIAPEQLYFNIERVGNASAASIPLALADAVRDGVIDRPRRVFTPGFGAGAVAGYAVLRIDPAVMAGESEPAGPVDAAGAGGRRASQVATTSEDMRIAFSE